MKWLFVLALAVAGGVLVLFAGRPRSSSAPALPAAEAEPETRTRADPAPEPTADARSVLAEPSPSAPAEPLTLRIVSTVSFARAAEPVPHIAFELHSERANTIADGSPMSAAPVHPMDEPLLAGRTDAEGVALVELEGGAFERHEDGRPRVQARVVEPGYQQRFGRVSSRSAAESEPDTIKLMAVGGATARGRVVDPEGRGAQADVRLREWRTYQGIRKLGGGAGTRQLVEGWFELDLREDVTAGVLVAEAGALGTGSLSDVELSLADPPQDLLIVVGGPGRLRGRVVDASNAPAAGVELLAWFAEFDDARGSFVSPEPAYSLRRAEGGGRLWVTAETDRDGGFDIRGLRAAPYVLRARTGQEHRSGYPILLTKPPVEADGTRLRLQLTRPHVAVRVLAPDGSVWKGPAARVRESSPWADRMTEWPEVPTVMIFACTTAGAQDVVEGAPLEGRMAGPDEAIFEVPAGARYLVGALGGGFDGSLQVVELAQGAGRVDVALTAPEVRELGSVSVHVVHDGRELDGRSMQESDFDVFLEALDTGAVLVSREEYGEPAPFVLSAPAGRYRLVVEGVPFVDTHHGTLMKERVLGRTEEVVQLVAGETREVRVELRAGGRLEVALAGHAEEADLDAVLESYPFLGEPGREAEWRAFASRARLFLVTPGRRPESIFTTVELTGTSAAGTHLEPRWPLGETHLSQILPAGEHRLRARMPGGRAVETDISVRSDSTTKVELSF